MSTDPQVSMALMGVVKDDEVHLCVYDYCDTAQSSHCNGIKLGMYY